MRNYHGRKNRRGERGRTQISGDGGEREGAMPREGRPKGEERGGAEHGFLSCLRFSL